MSRIGVSALVTALAARGGDDPTRVGPRTNTCTGTCLVVSSQSASLAITEVFYSACTEPGWGADRLPGGEVLHPGSSRGWQVARGCWDFRAARVAGSESWVSASYGIDLAAGTTHTLVFDF